MIIVINSYYCSSKSRCTYRQLKPSGQRILLERWMR